jgi:hypothetical protein
MVSLWILNKLNFCLWGLYSLSMHNVHGSNLTNKSYGNIYLICGISLQCLNTWHCWQTIFAFSFVIYLWWPIAPSYTSPNAGDLRVMNRWGGDGKVAGSQPMSTAVHVTWHGAQTNFGDLLLQLFISPKCGPTFLGFFFILILYTG